VITASHNPANYNGRSNSKRGTEGRRCRDVSRESANRSDSASGREGGSISEEDLVDDYVAALRQRLDIKKILGAKLAILHDRSRRLAQIPSKILGLDYVGNARILRRSLERLVTSVVDTVRGEINPSFGGVNPSRFRKTSTQRTT